MFVGTNGALELCGIGEYRAYLLVLVALVGISFG